MAADTVDVIVLGGGPAGENAAASAIAGSDRTAVLVEADLLGGECSYWACMPSKALLTPPRVLDTARHMPGVAGRIDAHGVDVAAVLARRDRFTAHHDDTGQVSWARDAGIDVVRGHARLGGDRTVTVDDAGTSRTLRARHAVVVATGSVPTVPDLPGLRAARPWTSRDATNLRQIPRRVVLVGGGVVACEAATWLRHLGVEQLTVVVRGPRLLPHVDAVAAAAVADTLRGHAVDIRFGTQVQSVTRPGAAHTGIGLVHGGPVTVTLDDGTTVTADEIVLATGRRPATTDLGVDTVGLTPGDPITVDEHLTATDVTGGWLYAIGDVTGRAALTHMGKYQARVCGDVIAARADGRRLDAPRYRTVADPNAIPQVIFTDPEIAAVGHTTATAREAGLDVEPLTVDLDVAGAALARDDTSGHATLVVERGTGIVVGATFTGPDVAELLHAATIAVTARLTVDTLWHAVPAYPTISEVWLRLLETRRP